MRRPEPGWLFLCLFFLTVAPAKLWANDTVLRLTMQHAADDPVGKVIMRFKNEVESKTNGAVKIEVLDKGQLYPDYQVPEVIGGGAVEMGVTQLANFSQHVPVAGVFMQPFLFNFDAIVRAASKPGSDIRTVIDAAIVKDTGARVLWWKPYGWNVIFSKEAITNPKSIVSRNVRVFDEVAAEFVKLCGATPQVISESKQVEALDLNLVDSTMTSESNVKHYELWKKTNIISDIRHSANILVLLVNNDIWEKIPKDRQTVLLDAAKKFEAEAWAGFDAEQSAVNSYAKAKGMSVKRPAANDLIEWRVCSSAILESFMSRAGKSGADLLSAYGRLRADPCCGVDPTAAQ